MGSDIIFPSPKSESTWQQVGGWFLGHVTIKDKW